MSPPGGKILLKRDAWNGVGHHWLLKVETNGTFETFFGDDHDRISIREIQIATAFIPQSETRTNNLCT